MVKILINSVPKSGTNLLLQIIKGIPGVYNEQSISYDGEHFRELLKIKPGQVVCAHIPYNEAFSRELEAHSIKQVFIYRDPRDVVVSLVHFINEKFHLHPLYAVFQTRLQTFDEQLKAVILGIDFTEGERNNSWGLGSYPGFYEELRMIYEWRNDPSVYSLRFEDLTRSPLSKSQTLLGIADYLWEDVKMPGMGKSELVIVMNQNINPQTSWTFRKGKIGSWREEFTLENKNNFKKMTGDFLIELGYEQDNEW